MKGPCGRSLWTIENCGKSLWKGHERKKKSKSLRDFEFLFAETRLDNPRATPGEPQGTAGVPRGTLAVPCEKVPVDDRELWKVPVEGSRTKKDSKSLREFEFLFARNLFRIIVSEGLQSQLRTCKGVKNLHFVHFWALGPIGNDSSRNFRSNGPFPIEIGEFSCHFGPKQGSTSSEHAFCG